MLTLEQVRELQRLLAVRGKHPQDHGPECNCRACVDASGVQLARLLTEVHVEALLDAAERVAREAASRVEPNIYHNVNWTEVGRTERELEYGLAYDDASEEERAAVIDSTLDTAFAARVEELRPELMAWLRGRPILTERGARTVSPHAVTLEQIESWLGYHGVLSRVRMVGLELHIGRRGAGLMKRF